MSDPLHVDVEGDERLPALLLLHGLMSSNLQWEPNRARLREHFRLVAVELWGHGRSPAPGEAERYRVESYVAELERIRGTLGIGRWLVCGQSFGAGIAIRYALAHPDTTAALIITNSRSALNDVSREASGRGGLEALRSVDRRSLPFHPCHAKRFPAELKARMEASADAMPIEALWHAISTTVRDLSCRHLVAGLALPALLVNGRYERSFQADRDFAVATIPDLEVADLDAGHSVNIEAPVDFDRAVIDFGRRHA